MPGFPPTDASPDAYAAAPGRTSVLRRHRGLVTALIVAGVAVGLLGLLVRDVYGFHPPANFACPPAISDAVQAATGCRIEPGVDEEE